MGTVYQWIQNLSVWLVLSAVILHFVKNVKIWVPILDKRRSSCYYKKTERTLFFINDRKEVQYAKSIFIIGRQ